MTFMQGLKNLFSQKQSEARTVITHHQIGKPVHTPANYDNFSREGFSKNIVVYICVSKIATACSGINWVLYNKGKGRKKKLTEISDSPMLDLWDKPNPLQSTAAFVESAIAFYEISGNSYIEANTGVFESQVAPVELWNVNPSRIKIVAGQKGYVGAYEVTANGMTRTFPVDPVKLTSKILHMKSFNPLDEWYGMSALQAAMLSLDQNNAGQKWNLSLLQNGASPSGVLQMKITDANPMGSLTQEQYDRIKSEFYNTYMGARNAGRPQLLEGGLEWKQTSMGPKDMDYVNNKNVTAVDICTAFGVPPEIAGLGTKTFANYKEARQAFTVEKILPRMDSFRDALNMWLTPAFSESYYFDYDRDDIEALAEIRESKYISLQAVSFLNENEKRKSCDYEEIEGFGVFRIGNEFITPKMLKELENEEQTSNQPSPEPPVEQETEQNEDREDETGDDDADKGWKSINLVNTSEKRRSWRAQNRKRKQLAVYFERDLATDFKDLTQEIVKVADALKGRDARTIEFSLQKTVSDWAEKDLTKTMKKHVRYTLDDFGGVIFNEGKSLGIHIERKANLKYDQFVNSYIERRTGTQIKTISNTSEKQIKRIVSEWVQDSIVTGTNVDELSFYLEKEFKGLGESNAQRIARTEVSLASNNATLEAVKTLQIPGMVKEWISADDGRVRNTDWADHTSVNDMNGPIGIDEKFKVNPDQQMDGPGDTSAPASQVINCRCVLAFKSNNTGQL